MDMRTWQRLTNPLRSRIASLLRRGVTTSVDAAQRMQAIQASTLDEVPLDNMEHFEPYGLTSHPHPGSEPLIMQVEGKRGHEVVVSIADRRYRLQGLAEGEVALYDDLGNVIRLGRAQLTVDAVQHLAVTAPTAEITATTTHIGDVTINGNLVVTGNISADGEITDLAASGGSTLSHVRSVYDGHTHPGDSGGTTGTPNQAM